MNIILSDLQCRTQLLPLTFTKPTALLRIGIDTIEQKWKHYLKGNFSYHTANYLQDSFPLIIKDDNWVLNSAIIPTQALSEAVKYLDSGASLVNENTWIATRISKDDFVDFLKSGAPNNEEISYSNPLTVINRPWDLFKNNAKQIEADFDRITAKRTSAKAHPTATLINSERIFIEEGASVVNCSLNASDGAIYIAKNAKVLDGALIRGPFALCEHAQVNMGAKIRDASTIGPHCKVGGEINNSILMGYSNKGHDGFLGNSVLGEWCNLGADTNTSNLKNNYSNVRVWSYAENDSINTNQQFCGLIMGDHSKCGINTMFNTGTVVGVSANIYGGDFPPKFIPSFSWGGSSGFVEYELNKAFETAERVMDRRNVALTSQMKSVLSHIFENSKKYRN